MQVTYGIKRRHWFGRRLWFLIVRHEERIGPFSSEEEVRRECDHRRCSPCMNLKDGRCPKAG